MAKSQSRKNAQAVKTHAILAGETINPIMAPLEFNEDLNWDGEYLEITGSSNLSVEDAVAKAIRRAYQTKKHLTEFQLIDTHSCNGVGREQAWQVTLKVGCSMIPETEE